MFRKNLKVDIADLKITICNDDFTFDDAVKASKAFATFCKELKINHKCDKTKMFCKEEGSVFVFASKDDIIRIKLSIA